MNSVCGLLHLNPICTVYSYGIAKLIFFEALLSEIEIDILGHIHSFICRLIHHMPLDLLKYSNKAVTLIPRLHRQLW